MYPKYNFTLIQISHFNIKIHIKLGGFCPNLNNTSDTLLRQVEGLNFIFSMTAFWLVCLDRFLY